MEEYKTNNMDSKNENNSIVNDGVSNQNSSIEQINNVPKKNTILEDVMYE